MRRWSDEAVAEVKKLRGEGLSYGQLSERLGLAKSTLHYWIGGTQRPEKYRNADRKRWIKEFQPLGALANKRLKDEFLENVKLQAEREVKRFPKSKIISKSILAALYWAEGAKGRSQALKFANNDPKLNLLFITLLRRCYVIDESKLRIRLHLHYYHKARLAKKFWSELLNVPLNQFGKIYWKARSKSKRFRRNFGGTCFVGYNGIRLKDEIMAFALATADKLINN